MHARPLVNHATSQKGSHLHGLLLVWECLALAILWTLPALPVTSRAAPAHSIQGPTPSCTLPSMNFVLAGERIIHRKSPGSNSEVLREYKMRIAKVLQQGTSGGRVVK